MPEIMTRWVVGASLFCVGGLCAIGCAGASQTAAAPAAAPDESDSLREYRPLTSRSTVASASSSEATSGSTRTVASHEDESRVPDRDAEPSVPSASSGREDVGPVVPKSGDRFGGFSESEMSGEAATAMAPVQPVAAAAPAGNTDNDANLEAAIAADAEAANAVATLSVQFKGKKKVKGCAVSVGGHSVGRAPMREVEVPAGKHKVVVKCNKRQVGDKVVNFAAGAHEAVVVAPAGKKKLKLSLK